MTSHLESINHLASRAPVGSRVENRIELSPALSAPRGMGKPCCDQPFSWKGLGPERIAMLQRRIEDIRYFWGNDLRFLTQFG